jgi:hypothetical protein
MQSCAMQRLQGSGTPSTSGRIEPEVRGAAACARPRADVPRPAALTWCTCWTQQALRRVHHRAHGSCSRVGPRRLTQCAAFTRILVSSRRWIAQQHTNSARQGYLACLCGMGMSYAPGSAARPAARAACAHEATSWRCTAHTAVLPRMTASPAAATSTHTDVSHEAVAANGMPSMASCATRACMQQQLLMLRALSQLAPALPLHCARTAKPLHVP